MNARISKIAILAMLVFVGAEAHATGNGSHHHGNGYSGGWGYVSSWFHQVSDWFHHHAPAPSSPPDCTGGPGDVVATPEPGTFLMLGAMGGMLAARRRRAAAPLEA